MELNSQVFHVVEERQHLSQLVHRIRRNAFCGTNPFSLDMLHNINFAPVSPCPLAQPL
jgi:hypothetical protein